MFSTYCDMIAVSRDNGTNKAAIARQRRGKQMSAVTNNPATIEDAVFPVRPLIGNLSVNMLSQQRIRTQKWWTFEAMFSVRSVPRLYNEDEWEIIRWEAF
jgi:hypothetical protein